MLPEPTAPPYNEKQEVDVFWLRCSTVIVEAAMMVMVLTPPKNETFFELMDQETHGLLERAGYGQRQKQGRTH